jgi:hypothetical protein
MKNYIIYRKGKKRKVKSPNCKNASIPRYTISREGNILKFSAGKIKPITDK